LYAVVAESNGEELAAGIITSETSHGGSASSGTYLGNINPPISLRVSGIPSAAPSVTDVVLLTITVAILQSVRDSGLLWQASAPSSFSQWLSHCPVKNEICRR